jgi:hypothetical protein
MMHAAIYDAVNSIDRSHQPYMISVRAPRGASETAAADAAAHTVLVDLYPAQQSALDTDLAAELANVPDGPAKVTGLRAGAEVARGLLAIRADDGSTVAAPPFVPGTNPGDYRPTPPNLATAVFTTWGQVTPFVLESADQFRPIAPPALTSTAYASAINEEPRWVRPHHHRSPRLDVRHGLNGISCDRVEMQPVASPVKKSAVMQTPAQRAPRGSSRSSRPRSARAVSGSGRAAALRAARSAGWW